MMRAISVLLAAAMVLASLGCGIERVEAEREALVAPPLRFFPRQNLRLTNNKLFLWKENVSAEQVSRARAIAEEIDRLDLLAAPLVARSAELEATLAPLEERSKILMRELRPVRRLSQGSERRAAELETELTAIRAQLGEEEAKTPPDAQRVAELSRQVAVLEGQEQLLGEQIRQIDAIRGRMENDLDELRSSLEPLKAELNDIEGQRAVIEERGRIQVEAITEIVDWFKDQPTSVVFQFERDGSNQVSISGWGLGDDQGPRSFSTRAGTGRKPTIENVTYAESGGVVTFDVKVYDDEAQERLRETYAFRLARTRYDAEDGRIYLSGEIVRTRPHGDVRRGSVKMIDRNN